MPYTVGARHIIHYVLRKVPKTDVAINNEKKRSERRKHCARWL